MMFFLIFLGSFFFWRVFRVMSKKYLLFRVGRGSVLIIVRLMFIIVVNWNSLVMLDFVILVFIVIIVIGLESLLVVCVKLRNICFSFLVIVVVSFMNLLEVFWVVLLRLVVFILWSFVFFESWILIFFVLLYVKLGVIFIFRRLGKFLCWIWKLRGCFGLFLMVFMRLKIEFLVVLRDFFVMDSIIFFVLSFFWDVVDLVIILGIIILGMYFCFIKFIVSIWLKRIV